MRLRLLHSMIVAASLTAAPIFAQPPAPPKPPAPPSLPGRYQGRGEETERVSQKAKLGAQGAVTLSNISGNIIVTGGGGDEVTIDAVKHARGRDELNAVTIHVDQRPGRVDIRADYRGSMSGGFHGDRLWVDFTVTIPADASVDAHSVSGDIRITGVQGIVRAETVSGNVTAAKAPRVDRAKSVSGDVDLSDVTSDSDLSAGSVSGSVRAKGLKTRSLDLNTVSGDVTLTNVTCERVGIRSVSGNVEYDGPLARSGRYDFNSHSGNVRLVIGTGTGFELNASSFSGSIRSDLPLTVGGSGAGSGEGSGRGSDRREVRRRGMGQTVRASFGDGSAMLTIRTFSGDVVIAKK